jgi:hypothetical protein
MPAARRKNDVDGLAVVDAPLDQLRPHPRNPRKITAARLEQLQRTLEAERDMLRARPVIALLDGTVVAGNQRLVAARALGWESIPTVFADLDEQQQTRWMLLDNRPFGEDVDEDVAALLAELDAAGSDLLLTGYDSADIDRILASVGGERPDPDTAPDVPAQPASVPGTVYELGPRYAIRDGRPARRTKDRTQTTLWEINLDKNVEGGHSTQKPVECMARPIRNHEPCDVYDPFCGSGTTVIAAETLGRRCFAMELDPGYCDVIRQRYADYTNQPDLAP